MIGRIVWSLLLAAGVLWGQSPGGGARPNLVLLLADDLRWDALGCEGNPVVRTPHIDRLAQEGIRFSRAFVTTPICAVSRASIFSGQYERRHGIDDFQKEFTDAAWSKTYPAMLRASGYWMGFIGKFGVGDRMPEGAFDYWRGFPGQGRYFETNRTRHLTAVMGDQAIEFLRTRPPDRPFCLSVSFKAPHAQDAAPREFPPDPVDEQLYEEVTILPPSKGGEESHVRLPDSVRQSESRRRWERRFATPEMRERTVRDYYRLVTGLDREVGRIRVALRELDLEQHTLVVFASDNGFFLGERGLADKWYLYEESLRVPLIVHDPRVQASRRGRTVEALALNLDLAPTLLDYAGLEPPGDMQGASLRPWIEARSVRGWRTAFLAEHHTLPSIIPPSEGVRTTRWKFVRWLEVGPEGDELYDLRRDPEELRNLAGEQRSQRRLETLRREWIRLREEAG